MSTSVGIAGGESSRRASTDRRASETCSGPSRTVVARVARNISATRSGAQSRRGRNRGRKASAATSQQGGSEDDASQAQGYGCIQVQITPQHTPRGQPVIFRGCMHRASLSLSLILVLG